MPRLLFVVGLYMTLTAQARTVSTKRCGGDLIWPFPESTVNLDISPQITVCRTDGLTVRTQKSLARGISFIDLTSGVEVLFTADNLSNDLLELTLAHDLESGHEYELTALTSTGCWRDRSPPQTVRIVADGAPVPLAMSGGRQSALLFSEPMDWDSLREHVDVMVDGEWVENAARILTAGSDSLFDCEGCEARDVKVMFSDFRDEYIATLRVRAGAMAKSGRLVEEDFILDEVEDAGLDRLWRVNHEPR